MAFRGRDADVGGVFAAWDRQGRMEAMGEGHLGTAAQVLDAVDLPPGARFLDAGCGAGWAGLRLARRLDRVEVVAFDLVESLLQKVRRRPGVRHVFRADLRRIPLRAATVDAAFSMEVLYYLPDPDQGLAELARVLKPGGRLDILIDYYEENPYSVHWPGLVGVAMVRRTMEAWRRAVEAAGFPGATARRVLPALDASRGRRADEDPEYGAWARHVGSLHVGGRRA